ncbi:DUF2336 domain-containing protein [Nonomuraea sp. WAC 01424]|uniref:DUF2336 domain-containing protein n=1 Tax=Nonomuraea sp. WAC 01424 TaxID=2203200 RepID=UPI001C8C2A2D|nr:DUF2336 domain-containing protein [Nonomuraea sp. WAC 01424]
MGEVLPLGQTPGDVLVGNHDQPVNSVLCGLAANPALLPDLVVLTADDVDPVAQPFAALALLSEGVGRPAWACLLATDPTIERLAACPGLPAEVQEILAADPEIRIVAELASRATADMAARLAAHPHAEVRCAVAGSEAAPPAVLAALVTGEGLPPARRCLVCDREKTPFTHDPECPKFDCDLPPGAACDGSHESTVHQTHVNALWNPATPTAAVIGFADHPAMLMRWPLAVRPDLPALVYERLAASPEPGVRAALAENPAIGDGLIRALAAAPEPDVRRGLAFNPQVPLKVLTRLAGTTKIGSTLLPRIATASRTEIEELAASPDPVVRMLLAERRDLPPEIRDALAADLDAKVVKSIAPHPGLSDAWLRAMVERHGYESWPRWRRTRRLHRRCWRTWLDTSRRCARHCGRSPGTPTRRLRHSWSACRTGRWWRPRPPTRPYRPG